MPQDLGLEEARRIAIEASGLGLSFPAGHGGAAAALRHLSSVQIDTISVVERAHHHILWARVPRYSKASIEVLEAEPRRAIEYWSHAAAWIPLEDYRFCLPRMRRVKARGHDWFRVEASVVRRVRERIRAEGPLRVQDFEKRPPSSKGWWDWKPSKLGLEYLFHAGELASVGRPGFQKLYDLTERVLPPGLDLSMPDEAQMASWYLDMAERSLGVFRARDVAYMRKDLTGGIGAELEARLEAGSLVRVELEGVEGREPGYAARAGLEGLAGKRAARAFILSPFDPLVIDRKRLKALFGFEYSIECYLPEGKRSFGYFALPILWRPATGLPLFAGRLDAKARRAEAVLELRRLSVGGVPASQRRSFAAALGSEIRRYAAFNGCESLDLGLLEAEDKALAASLRAAIEGGD
jgi:uncharacterized protein YcaQ